MMTVETPDTEDIHLLPFPAKSQIFFWGTMPLPPSVDAAYKIITIHRNKGDIHRLGPSAELDQFKRDAALMLSQAPVQDWSLINAIRESKRHVPLAVELRIYFPVMYKSDLDNREKFAIDAAFNRMQLNDKLVVDIHLIEEEDAIEPRAEINVRCVVR